MNMDELLNIVITCVILSSVLPGLPESPVLHGEAIHQLQI